MGRAASCESTGVFNGPFELLRDSIPALVLTTRTHLSELKDG